MRWEPQVENALVLHRVHFQHGGDKAAIGGQNEAKGQKQGDVRGEHDDLVATSVRASQLQHGLDFTYKMIARIEMLDQ